MNRMTPPGLLQNVLIGLLLVCCVAHTTSTAAGTGAVVSSSVGPKQSSHKILVLPLSEKTHMLVHLKLAAELARRNHTVHFMTPECYQPFAQGIAAQMLDGTSATINWVPYELNCTHYQEDNRNNQLKHPFRAIAQILLNIIKRADELLGDQQLMQQLTELQADFMVSDVHSFGMFTALKLGIPHVDLDVGTGGLLWEPVLYGAESAGTSVPMLGSMLPTSRMTLWQRAANIAITFLSEAFFRWAFYGQQGWAMQIIKRHNVPWTFPYKSGMLLLVNSHFVLEPPRAVSPNIHYIGPILPQPAQQLPWDLLQWVEGAGPRGVVYISFGGMLQAPIAASRTIIKAMQMMPDVRFVWSLSKQQQAALAEELSQLPHLFVREWVPQNDLLAHTSVRVFVTQGGYLSMAEATYHGVPVLGLPFIPGQSEIIQFSQDNGRGRLLPGDSLVKGRVSVFTAALTDILDTPRYQKAAEIAQLRIRAAPRSYAETAAERVELAAELRHHGPYLHPEKMHQRWWQQKAMDVLLLYVVLGAIPAALLWVTISRAVRGIFGGTRGARQGGWVGPATTAVILSDNPQRHTNAKGGGGDMKKHI